MFFKNRETAENNGDKPPPFFENPVSGHESKSREVEPKGVIQKKIVPEAFMVAGDNQGPAFKPTGAFFSGNAQSKQKTIQKQHS